MPTIPLQSLELPSGSYRPFVQDKQITINVKILNLEAITANMAYVRKRYGIKI